MGMKSQGIRGSFNFEVKRWVIGGNIYSNIYLGVDRASEGCKMGSEVLFDGFHFSVYGEMHFFIDGGKIGTELPHFVFGLCEITGQEIEASFQFLATGVGHDEEGKQKGIGGTTHKMGYG
jgi:hypothetical protein